LLMTGPPVELDGFAKLCIAWSRYPASLDWALLLGNVL
jgi:hypothetical protein